MNVNPHKIYIIYLAETWYSSAFVLNSVLI